MQEKLKMRKKTVPSDLDVELVYICEDDCLVFVLI